ncbi:uncharacterized protein NECHADRAFT_83366 [Fusarium vanettenii 77-13-4]|uniref:PARP catalytic domain-containing protein n=1 Tax=Fusarium vanettenii (strain ATCC MYA-4622 / CBS 123669 / FGSC 9596 / NRRL 45880 / 77-13-4) TaxID=660122 RepID=C7Z3U0_FUSV7|nr:uncharacterized protein NECHADRAFT_83366 [Fusarium vanettenii 77-13-4]EEU41367.1 hypothetical protein NECHADRAFT_83366 [Fusarium vanettenii 77-13-4]
MSDVCLQCGYYAKDPAHTFCDKHCARDAANNAPSLIKIPRDHVMYNNAASAFYGGWNGTPPPIRTIYLVTWTQESRNEFEAYRDKIESDEDFIAMGKYAGNERKRFRGAERACTIGENGNVTMCYNGDCKLCETLREGFRSYLDLKRSTGYHGTRLGPGLYSTCDTSKAAKYAINKVPSNVHALMLCRVVIGHPYVTEREMPHLQQPPPGFNSVYARPGPSSHFNTDETVVYTSRAMRPAYLIIY